MGAHISLEKSTPLYMDMYIATKFLHKTHEEFLKLPEVEKLKLRAFLHVKNLKEEKRNKEMAFDEPKLGADVGPRMA